MALFACLLVSSLFLAVLGFSYVLFHRDHFSYEESGPISVIFALMALFVNLEPFMRIVAIVLTLFWTHRAYSNLSPLKARQLEASPGWAVGYWLIPFVNLLKPFQVMREIWHGSDPQIEENNLYYRQKAGTPELIGFWWGLFLVSGIAISVSNIMAGNETRGESTFFPTALVLSQLLRTGAALLIILIVREITKRQELRFKKLTEENYSGFEPPPPPDFERSGGPEENMRGQEDA